MTSYAPTKNHEYTFNGHLVKNVGVKPYMPIAQGSEVSEGTIFGC